MMQSFRDRIKKVKICSMFFVRTHKAASLSYRKEYLVPYKRGV